METSVNNKCKAFTSLEQSRKLAEILPIESADMKFPYFGDGQHETTALFGKPIEFSGGKDILCWSLAALVGIFPPSYDDGQHFFALINNNLYGYTEWLCCYEASNGNTLNECYADNPIDACYNMVLKLKERDLI